MQMGDAKVLTPTRSFWVGALYPAETKEKTCKDMVMTCRAVAVVAGQAAAATADAGPDNAPRDPAPDVTPSGRPGCKNAAAMLRGEHGKVRSNQAEAGPSAKIFTRRRLRWPSRGAAAAADAICRSRRRCRYRRLCCRRRSRPCSLARYCWLARQRRQRCAACRHASLQK